MYTKNLPEWGEGRRRGEVSDTPTLQHVMQGTEKRSNTHRNPKTAAAAAAAAGILVAPGHRRDALQKTRK